MSAESVVCVELEFCRYQLRKLCAYPTLQALFLRGIGWLFEAHGDTKEIAAYTASATAVYDEIGKSISMPVSIASVVPFASATDLAQVKAEIVLHSWGFIIGLMRNGSVDRCEEVVRYLQGKVLKKQVIEASLIKTVISQALPLFKSLPNVLSVQRARASTVEGLKVGNLTVVGDLHGQFDDLMNILTDQKVGGFPSDHNQILFNGDIVDRGRNSVELLMVLVCIKILRPGAVHILRGNHESQSMNSTYGFHKYMDEDYGNNRESGELKLLFAELFCALPIAAVIEDAVFVTHGGLGATVGTMTIADINTGIDRFGEPASSGPMHELLWNDPTDSMAPSCNRNTNRDMFTCAETKAFLARNNLRFMIRSHEECAMGYEKHHDDLCWTVFSASNYCGSRDNKGAVIRFVNADLTPTVVQFRAQYNY